MQFCLDGGRWAAVTGVTTRAVAPKATADEAHDENQQDQDSRDHPEHQHPPWRARRQFPVSGAAGVAVGRNNHGSALLCRASPRPMMIVKFCKTL